MFNRPRKPRAGRWLKSLAALGSRLRWRSHFSQKLQDAPSIEHENMCSTYDDLRTDFDEAKCAAQAGCAAHLPRSSPICSQLCAFCSEAPGVLRRLKCSVVLRLFLIF